MVVKEIRRIEEGGMKRRLSTGERIKALRGGESQAEFAKHFGVSQGAVSAWERNDEDRAASAEIYFRLANLASDPADKIFFLGKAGLDEQTILSAAEKLSRGRVKAPNSLVEKGSVVLVPRFRETLKGREGAGPPVPLPAEFIPHPGATICLAVSQTDFRIAAPRGLFLLDESVKDTEDLSALWERVVLLDYPSALGLYPAGLHVGRLYMGTHGTRPGSGVPLDTRYLVWHGWLRSVDAPAGYQAIHFGEWRHPLFEKYTVPQPNQNWRPREVVPSEIEEFEAACREAEERAPKEFHLPKGVRILGKVIGRLTGHLK
jgi:transcriptional regulator with XRE-family HTH domain